MGERTTFDTLIAKVARMPAASEEEMTRARSGKDDTDLAATLIGQVFGSYRIVSQLGAGGMGWVFLAEHSVLGSHAAIKVLDPKHSQRESLVQRFFDEARAASRVADPAIVTVLDFGWHTSGSAYLVMEHLTGETLGRRVKANGQLAPAKALAVLRQCAIAMAAAHARGIVHRDLKPDNIFIVPDPAVATERIKVLDFGIAKLLEGDASHGGTQTGLILGTPGYMSPEQCRGAGDVDHRTDIYALGCVLFFMLSGRPPFTAGSPGDLIAAHLTQPPPTPSSLIDGISPAIDALVARCLAKDAGERIQTMTALCDAIDAATAMPASNARRRSLRWLAIGGGLAIGAAAALAGSLSGDDRSRSALSKVTEPPVVTAPAPTVAAPDAAGVTTDAAGSAALPPPDKAAITSAPTRPDDRPKRPAGKPPAAAAHASASKTDEHETGAPPAGSAAPPSAGEDSSAPRRHDDPYDRR